MTALDQQRGHLSAERGSMRGAGRMSKLQFFRNEQFLHADEVRDLFDYDAATGTLIRKKTIRSNARSGDVVGFKRGPGKGYLAVCINRRVYDVHRIIWLHQKSRWPSDRLDHVNGDTHDNRLENLREVTQQQNRYNSARPFTATNPFRGVHKHSNRYRAVIQKDGKQIRLGSFRTAEEARQARIRAEAEFYGSFSFEARPSSGVGAPHEEVSRMQPREV